MPLPLRAQRREHVMSGLFRPHRGTISPFPLSKFLKGMRGADQQVGGDFFSEFE